MKFVADESSAIAIEYGLIAAGIALAIVEIIYASAPISSRSCNRWRRR
ncbi:Flp pilus assembly pilin Flp [Bradyrhizobium sp. USDA 4354]